MPTRWTDSTIDWICCNKGYIEYVAGMLGVPPEAIAGIMAKENDPYVRNPWQNQMLDEYAAGLGWTGEQWYARYLQERDIIPPTNFWLLVYYKWKYPTLIDAGPGNFQIGTAIRLLEQYIKDYPSSDPLQLKQYAEDLSKLVSTLTHPGQDCNETGKLTAALFGLMIKEGGDFFNQYADPTYWGSRPRVERDAILVTYCALGRRAIEANRDAAIKAGIPYKPQAGPGTSGGQDHIYNACRVGKAMLNPLYGYPDPQCILPKCSFLDPQDCKFKKVPCGDGGGFGGAANAGPSRRRDPLVLDLDGDGIRTISVNDGAYFDHNGDGFAELSAWVDPNDGLLVMDRNGDGLISCGKELFGTDTVLKSGAKAANGFQALAEWDSNQDGRIDASDEAFSKLQVWKDLDGDGLSFELYSLEELGIKSISLSSTPDSTTDPQGNTRTRIGSFEKTDGSVAQIAEYGLQRDTIHTIVYELLEVPEDIAERPDLQGYGNVYDLHQAMVRDTCGQLKSLVEGFIAESDINVRGHLMDQILFKWTGSDTVDPQSRGNEIDARKLAVLEKFFGQSFVGENGSNPTYYAAVSLNESYRATFEWHYAGLMAQTHLADVWNKVTYTWDEEKQQYNSDMSGVIAELQAQLANDPEQGKQLLSEFARTMRGMGHDRVSCLPCREIFIMQDPELGWVIDTGGMPVIEDLHQGIRPWSNHMEGTDNAEAVRGSLTEGDEVMNSFSGDDVLYGTSRSETFYQESGDALIVGGGGHDIIFAGADNDILDGGEDDDTLYGESGNDTYIFRRGSGQDTIIDADATPNNTDTIWLGSNLTPEDITLKRWMGSDLVLKINDTTDTLTVKDYFKNDSPLNKIEQIQFMDGTVWTEEDIFREAFAPTGGDDVIYGRSENDFLTGLGGNDTIYGRAGDDILHGDAGNDRLCGEAGDDILDRKLIGHHGIVHLDHKNGPFGLLTQVMGRVVESRSMERSVSEGGLLQPFFQPGPRSEFRGFRGSWWALKPLLGRASLPQGCGGCTPVGCPTGG